MEVGALSLTLRAIGADAVGRAMAAVRRELKATADAAKATDGQMDALKSQLTGMAATIGAAFGAQQLVTMADSYATLTARLKIATGSAEELARVQGALFQIAQDQRVPLEAVTDLYGRMALSADALGLRQADLLRLTTTISQALAISGTSAEAASGALQQLGQAFGSEKIQMEEFGSLLDGLPRLTRAAAEGMGITVSELTKRVREGKVTSQEFAQAILQNQKVAEEFAQVPRTIGGALTQFRNDILQMVGRINESTEATQKFTQALDIVRQNLPQIIGLVAGLASTWLAYNAAIRTAIILNGVMTAAQTITAFLSLARAVRSVADGMALISLVGGGVIKAVAAVAAITVGVLAYKKAVQEIEGLTAGAMAGAPGVGAAPVVPPLPKIPPIVPKTTTGKTVREEQLSAFEEYFRQQGLGRKPLPQIEPESFMAVVDPAKLRATAREVGALVDTTFSEEVLSVANGLGEQLRNVLANGIASAFETLVTRGATIGDAFGALGATLLRGLGDMLVTFGTSLLPVAKLFGAVVTSLKSLNPVAMTAAAVGLIAVGGMMRGAAGRAFGGVGGGSAPVIAGGGLGGAGGPMTLPGLTFGPTAAAAGPDLNPRSNMTFNIIGTNDPSAQRQLQEMLRNADRRGGTTTV